MCLYEQKWLIFSDNTLLSIISILLYILFARLNPFFIKYKWRNWLIWRFDLTINLQFQPEWKRLRWRTDRNLERQRIAIYYLEWLAHARWHKYRRGLKIFDTPWTAKN